MALANYSDLLSAGANWTGRGDLTSRIPEFIVLAEAKMNRKLRMKNMETQYIFSVDEEYIALPTDFGGIREIFVGSSPRTLLTFMPGNAEIATFGSDTGTPKYYDIIANSIRFAPIPDGAYTATMIYFKQVPALTGSNTTNWLMTSHPDAYLYGIMAEAAGFLTDWETQQAWESKMYKVLEEAIGASNKDKWGGVSMAVRLG